MNKYLEKVATRAHVRHLMKGDLLTHHSRKQVDLTKGIAKTTSDLQMFANELRKPSLGLNKRINSRA